MIIGEQRYFHKIPGHGPLAVKLVNDSYVYAAGAAAEKSTLSFSAFDSVDLVTPFLESGAIFIITKIEKTQGQLQGNQGRWSSPSTSPVSTPPSSSLTALPS